MSSFSVVTGSSAAVNNQVAIFNGTTGKAITNGAAAIGALGALRLANTTASSSISTGALICPGGAGIAGKVFIGSNTVLGPAQTIASETMLTLRGTNAGIAGPHLTAYSAIDQYPLTQHLNWQHDNINLSFDGYFDGAAWRSSTSSSNFQINKGSTSLNFSYNTGVVAGSALTWNAAGSITTAGTLQWNKPTAPRAGSAFPVRHPLVKRSRPNQPRYRHPQRRAD